MNISYTSLRPISSTHLCAQHLLYISEFTMAIRKSKKSQKHVTPAAESADESLNNLVPPAKVISTGRIIKKTLKAKEEDEHTDSDAPTTEPMIMKEKRPKTLDKI